MTLILYQCSSISNIIFPWDIWEQSQILFLFWKKTSLFFFIRKGSAGRRLQFPAHMLPGPFWQKVLIVLKTNNPSGIYRHLKGIKRGNLWLPPELHDLIKNTRGWILLLGDLYFYFPKWAGFPGVSQHQATSYLWGRRKEMLWLWQDRGYVRGPCQKTVSVGVCWVPLLSLSRRRMHLL